MADRLPAASLPPFKPPPTVSVPSLSSGTTSPKMEDLSTAAALVTAALVLWVVLFRCRRQLVLPPGPRPWPIIGNLNLIGELPHRSIHALSLKYGPLMQLRFGSHPVVVASSVDTARLVLKTQDITFASRPKTAAGKYTTYNYSDITWSPYGPYWRQARRLCLMELFSARRLESYEYIRVQEVGALLRELFEAAGQPVMLKDHLSSVSLNVISRMVLGKKYLDGEEAARAGFTPEEFKRMLDELFLLSGVLNIGDWIPWLAFLDLQGYVRRMKEVSRKFDRFLEHVLDEHIEARRAGGEGYEAKDMVGLLLQLADDPDLDVKLSRSGVKAFTQDLVAGGTESSAVTVEWAMSEMLKKPELFKLVTEELDRVVGRERLVQEKDIPSLPFLQSIVKETMRMHPVAPMLVPRLCREDCTLAGYDVPEGSRMLVNTWTIHRNPDIWDQPDEFRPERFLNKPIDGKGQFFELLPFGSGRRMCPGYSLGLKVIELSLANLLHCFTWKLPGTMKPEDVNMDEIFGLSTPRKVPLFTVVQPRLPSHIFKNSHN